MNEASVLRVVCLCAQWCGTCRDYVAVFEQASAGFPGHVAFTWVDIEDEADRLDGVEVENFPTLLIARGDQVLFYGPITPQPLTLARLVRSALAGDLQALPPNPPIDALARHASSTGAD